MDKNTGPEVAARQLTELKKQVLPSLCSFQGFQEQKASWPGTRHRWGSSTLNFLQAWAISRGGWH